MEDLEDFLKERGLDHEQVQKLREEKIDNQILLAMTDEQLKSFIPKLGDIIAVRKFCQTMADKEKSESRKETLLKRLRRKLGRKRANPMDQGDSDEDSKVVDTRRAKLKGNLNAKKEERKIEIGWCDYSEIWRSYRQVRKRNGGGTREVKCSTKWKANDILEYGKSLFFPDGFSTKGSVSKYTVSLKDFKQYDVPDDATIDDLYKTTNLRMLRFYVFSKKKQDYESELSDQSLPDPSVLDTSSSSASAHEGKMNPILHIPDSPLNSTTEDEFTVNSDLPKLRHTNSKLHLPRRSATSTSPNLNDLDSLPQTTNSNESTQTDNAEVTINNGLDPLETTFTELPFGTKTSTDTSVQIVVDDNITFSLDPLSYAVMTSMDETGYFTVQDTSPVDSNETVEVQQNHVNGVSFDNDVTESQSGNNRIFKFHQGNCYTELLGLFKEKGKELTVLQPYNVERMLPNGETEKGGGIGLLRDIFTEFWETFFSKCCNGDETKVPFLRTDMGESEWLAIGHILCEGWKRIGFLPVQIAKPVLEEALFGKSTGSITPAFLSYLPLSERVTITTALDKFPENDLDDLLEVLESHQCKKLPTILNIKHILEEIAHKEMLQEPRFIIDCWRKVFVENMYISQSQFEEHYEQKQPTVRKILKSLQFPETMDASQETASSFLRRFVKGLDQKGIKNFLRFCTGTSVMSDAIHIEFTKLIGFERRPQSHTCGCVLKLPSTYENFADLREEFENILASNVWTMEYI